MFEFDRQKSDVASCLTGALGRLCLAPALILGLGSVALAQSSPVLNQKTTGVASADSLVSRAQAAGNIRVIVTVDAPAAPAAFPTDPTGIAGEISRVSAARDPVIATHFGLSTPSSGVGFNRGLVTFPVTPGFAANVTASELEALAADPRVLAIQLDALEPPTLLQSVPLIGMTAAYNAGATGTGRTVAILDTGVKASHEFMGGGVSAEACFSNAGGGGGKVSLCPNGSSSQTGAGAADANTTQCNIAGGGAGSFNLCEHGTHVAGIAAGLNGGQSTGEPTNGVAKFSFIFAIQVFTRFNDNASCNNAPPCVLAFNSDVISGLNHVLTNPNPGGRPVASVNMSLGGGSNTTACDSDARKAPIDSLKSAGILTAIASGNNSFTSSISAPACISSSVAVGSTSKTDAISSFSNMSGLVTVVAPGGESGGGCAFGANNLGILGPVVVNGGSTTAYGCLIGTSMAAPHVAGAIAAIKSACPAATAAQIQSALVSTGLSVTDTRVGGSVTKPRIRVDQAVQQACNTPAVHYTIAGVADVNSDSRADIFIQSNSGAIGVWLSNGMAPITSGAFIGPALPGWQIKGTGKFDLTSPSGLLLFEPGSRDVAAWAISGFTLVNFGYVTRNLAPGWIIAGTGDFNADGKTDVLVHNTSTGDVGLWTMNDFTIQAGNIVFRLPLDWTIAGIGDFDADGKSDILLYNPTTRSVAIWLMNGAVIKTPGVVVTMPANWSIAGVGDVNSDGKADIVVRNATTGDVGTWLMNGVTLTSGFVVGNSPLDYSVSGVGNIDGLTGADILFRQANGDVVVWKLNPGGTAFAQATKITNAP